VDVRDDVAAVDRHRGVGGGAQRGVEDGAALGEVDGLAREHGVAAGGDAARLGEAEEEARGLLVDGGLGVVEEHVVERDREAGKAVGVRLEEGRRSERSPAARAGLLDLGPMRDPLMLPPCGVRARTFA
jgi:hypothetical protein